MIKILLLTISLVFSSLSFSASDDLILTKRQADALMTVTNVDIGDDLTTISATGKMGEYGTVYVTYHLTYATRTSGFVCRLLRFASKSCFGTRACQLPTNGVVNS